MVRKLLHLFYKEVGLLEDETCDYSVVEHLIDETLHLSVKDGVWTSKSIELCLPCQKRLHIFDSVSKSSIPVYLSYIDAHASIE